MKLEVGKTYLDRDGVHHTIDRQMPHGPYVNSNSTLSWSEHGTSYQRTDLDLVSEFITPSTTSSIPHADLIRAVLDGKTLQYKGPTMPGYVDYGNPHDALFRLVSPDPDIRVRLKSEPVVQWVPLSNTHNKVYIGCVHTDREVAARSYVIAQGVPTQKVLRLEIDPDTLDVISAKTESP